MFAYCNNNPVGYYDNGGNKPKSYDDTIDDEDGDVFILGLNGDGSWNGGIQDQLEKAASYANASVDGTGHVAGTKKHSVFASTVNDMNISYVATEVSYKDGIIVTHGTKGSIRFDVVQYDISGIPIKAWDFKTGSAVLSQWRINQMLTQSGLLIQIIELR